MNFLDTIFGRLGNRMFQMAYIYAQYKDGIIPDIYLQDPKYFDKYRAEIRHLFGQGKKDNRIALHIRRGDYVNNPFYVNLIDDGYYGRAMHLFPGERFFVFSDDIEWCKKAFADLPCDFSEGKSAEEDLKSMSGCKGIIMANSSLSWWGAYLGNGKVVYPKKWFSDGVKRVGFLEEWICI